MEPRLKSYINDRQYWLNTMLKIADPVLCSLSRQQLKINMPVESKMPDRGCYTHLEAFARLLVGMAPWLENPRLTGMEDEVRKKYAGLVREALDAATDPTSLDYMNFTTGSQPVVDMAFLAQAILRAPNELWSKLDSRIKQNVISALKSTRMIRPHFNNWLLFSAMIETVLYRICEDWDPMRIDFALKQHEQWYLGDGTYSDGPSYHCDYYNSFVIHPMLLDMSDQISEKYPDWFSQRENIIKRAQRQGVILERFISPEGTFPVIGRSITYRFGAFHLLAQLAQRHLLHPSLLPSQVRCALTAVIRRTVEVPDMFDEKGWLRIGFAGHQPRIGEEYISTGSLYLCSTVFLPLGLPVEDPFWHGNEDWTSKKAWLGQDFPIDHFI